MFVESGITRVIVSAALACTLPAAVAAATPTAQLQELDEVLVTVKTVVPLEDFLKFPKYESVAISPNGTQLAMAWIDKDYQLQVSLHEFPSMKTIHNHSLSSDLSGSEVGWASEQRLLIRTRWPLSGLPLIRESVGLIMTSDSNGGNPHFINREAISTREPLDIQRRDEAAVAASARPYNREQARISSRDSMGPVRVISTHTGKPDQLLFQTTRANQRSGSTEGTGIFVLDLKDNKQSQVATQPLNGGQVVTGPGHRAALVTGVNAANETLVYYLPENARAEGRDWQLVARSASGARGLRPVAWTGHGEEYYALDGRSTATLAVVIWNAADNTQRLVHRHPGIDLDQFALDPAGKVWMFSGVDNFPEYWYPDPEHPLARLHRAVVQKVPGEVVEITNAADDLKSAVVRVSSGRRPPVFLVVNVDSASSLAALFSYPTLRGRRLAQVDPIEFRARDGMVIRGYLTTPEDGNGKPRTGLPLVVIAQGGPGDAPAGPAFEYERQLFASRGYAVLQINARGSSGRGALFERAGDGKWGREVQDDFADGVRWAIRDGVADADRICTYGIGYGAYLATMTAAREPELFDCVIGVGGVYDLPRLLGEGKQDIPAALQQVLGSDMEELKARSPVSNAAAIKAKVMLMPQDRDEFFPLEQSTRMRAALKDAGNAAQWESLARQYTPETRAGGYSRVLRFLNQRIGEN